MNPFIPSTYGPHFESLLAVDRRRSLDAGTPDRAVRGELAKLSLETAFGHARVIDHDMASCCLAGVWLLHDFLDESHTVSQSIETRSGSFWHAIMHRREGDFSNSKYWLRRVGQHPVLELIDEQATARGGRWDAFTFVDECEKVVRRNQGDRERCLDVQQIEWELLFDHCYTAATGSA